MLLFAAIVFFSGCAAVDVKEPGKVISLDRALVQASEYIDIVYEDQSPSYASYLKKADLAEGDEKSSCGILPQKPDGVSNGAWVWDYRKATASPSETIGKLGRNNFKKVYIQIGENLDAFRPFLELSKREGIEVFGLDGSPEHVDDFRILAERIRVLKEFNQANKDASFAGFQIDVEPYLKKDFNIRKEHYIRQYLKMVRELKALSGDDLKFSVAVPFWFDKLAAEDRPLTFHVIDIADETVIMSYRTDYEEMLDSAFNELCYASAVNKPLFLGLEITRLPDERHLIVAKDDIISSYNPEDKKIFISNSKLVELPVFKRYDVKADRISFFSKIDMLQTILSKTPSFKSFSGYIIHSLEGL